MNAPAKSGAFVLALDPGATHTGFVRFDGQRVLQAGVMENGEVLEMVAADHSDILAIEGFRARGNVIDNNCVQTIRWEGRFQQAWGCPDEVLLIARQQVKKFLGLPGSANDKAVNAALRLRLGEKGTKRDPGPTHGVSTHAWAALAVAVTAANT